MTTGSWIQIAKLVAGGVVGGVLGHIVFTWLMGFGLYAIVLPGAGTGMGAAKMSRHRSAFAGVGIGFLGFLISLYSEWSVRPFVVDESFAYFVKHVHLLTPPTLIMVAIGVFYAAWAVK